MHQDEIIKQLQEQNEQLKLENELFKARVSEIELKARIRELEA
jgi:regulator of replication initiation timing